MRAILRFIGRNWFLCGLIGAIALALAAPDLGRSLNRGKILSTLAVVIIFVLSGLSLPSEAMRQGLRNVRAHVFLQAFIFIVAPLYFWSTGWLFQDQMEGRLIVGIYALAVLPTTISSCIVFTQMARGDGATTIFNAVLANALGVLVSPVLLTLLLRQAGQMMPMDEVMAIFAKLLLKVLVPFVIGQVLRLRLREFAGRHKKRMSKISSSLILLIVFLSFARAASDQTLRQGAGDLWGPMAYLAVSNLLLMALAFYGARLVGLSRANVVSAVFVAPQKTLAMGAPLLSTYFASRPDLLAYAMLPIPFYHPLQLLTAGMVRGFVQLPEEDVPSSG